MPMISSARLASRRDRRRTRGQRHRINTAIRLMRYFGAMRTTVTLDDELLAEAARLSGLRDRTPLLREALGALIERESARRLAALGGSEPQVSTPPRRRAA